MNASALVTSADQNQAAVMVELAEALIALGVLCEAPDPGHDQVARSLGIADWHQHSGGVFTLELLPYASIYLGADGMLGGEPAARIAGFWHALGYQVPAEPDHLAALLGLLAALVTAESEAERSGDLARAAAWRRARHTLLSEHLLTWVPAYTDAVAATGSTPHRAWARLLQHVLTEQADGLDSSTSPVRQALVAHLNDVPALPEETEDAAELARALLAPARSGLVITRGDLAAIAQRCNTGFRMGERAYALRHLLEDDAAPVLDELIGLAQTWVSRHHSRSGAFGPESAHWTGRARQTGAMLARHRAQIQSAQVHSDQSEVTP